MPSTTTFVEKLEATILGSDYAARHSGTGNNVVIWNQNRLALLGTHITWGHGDGTACADTKTAIAANFRDKQDPLARNVVAASLHLLTTIGEACIYDHLNRANNQIEAAFPQRWMTVLAGDLNRRPDFRGNLPTNGLETDPNCWYRKITPAQDNVSLVSGENCGTGGIKRYYDTVWLYPGSGGGTNPTATSFCEQFTFNNDLALGDVDIRDATNSCTDLVTNSQEPEPGQDGMDKSRIDYIWTSYEYANGTVWKPPAAVIAPFIEYASADLGQSLDAANLAEFYADHRAVQALVAWPPPPQV